MIRYYLSILIILVAGCASLANKEKLSSLEISTDRYGDAIRWGYLEMADGFRKKTDQERHSADFTRLKNIRVTSYDVLNRTISENYSEATQVVEIKYYIIDQMIEKTMLDMQVWKYDPEKEIWFLHGNLPDFGQDH